MIKNLKFNDSYLVRKLHLYTAIVVLAWLPLSIDFLFTLPITKSIQGPKKPRYANFEKQTPSRTAHNLANWVVNSGDNKNLFFVIVDKPTAKIFVFDAAGELRGATSALIGLAKGDDSVIGIGDKPLAAVKPQERTTPAGRFIGEVGHNLLGEDVVWVDYEAGISMHRVRALNPKERRLERLASTEVSDHRISYGCINIPAEFFNQFIKPAFTASLGVIYIVPEVKSIKEVFTSFYEVDALSSGKSQL